MEKTEKILTAVAILGLIVIGGVLLANRYGLAPEVDWSSPEAVAGAFVNQLDQIKQAGFLNRQDKLTYEYLAVEGKELADQQTGSLAAKIFAFSGTAETPSSFEISRRIEQGDKAQVEMAWHYASAYPDQAKTVFLIRQDGKWKIYSIVNTHGKK